jgi:membrane protein DedA with SNARE-associated domain
VLYLHSMAMTLVMGGLLRSHGGHKTWVAWAFTGVVCVVGLSIRFYRRRR